MVQSRIKIVAKTVNSTRGETKLHLNLKAINLMSMHTFD